MIAIAIAELGLRINKTKVSRLARFVDLLLEYNKKTALTSLRTSEEVVRNLLVDSLATSLARGFDEARNCLDVGAGGGFPSIALSLAFGGKSWVALERNRRKAAFLNIVARSLAMERYAVVCDDFRQIAYTREMTGRFDLVTLRAVRLDVEIVRAIRSVVVPRASVVLYRHGIAESLLRVYRSSASEMPPEQLVSIEAMSRDIRIRYTTLESLGDHI